MDKTKKLLIKVYSKIEQRSLRIVIELITSFENQ